MQRIELKVYTYEKYLQRKALADKEALELLHKFEARVSGNGDRKVTNVVENNINLRQELKEAISEINTLQLENVKMTNKLKDIERTHKLYNQGGSSSPVTDMDMYQTVDVAELGVGEQDSEYLGDFASGMSSIPVGVKPPPNNEILANQQCKTIEEAEEDLDDINIIDI